MGQYSGLGAGQFGGLFTNDRASTLSPFDFYVSNFGTGDGKKPSTPMSLAALNALSIPAGARILFNRGEIYSNFAITIQKNGVRFGAYGYGPQPVLDGSKYIGDQTWTSEGSNVFSTPYTASMKWLYVNNVSAQLAESQWFPITTQVSTTQLRATSLISAFGSTVVGAQVVTKEYYFTLSKVSNVTAYNNTTGQIDFDKALHVGSGMEGFSFKLFNMRQFMNTAGEWFYDTGVQKIYYQTTGSSPAGTNIRVCGNDYGVTLADGVSSFTAEDIAFARYNLAAIKGKDNNATILTNITVSNVRGNGIWLYGNNTGSQVLNSTFQNCDLNGMHFGAIQNFAIKGNIINNIGRGATIPFCMDIGTGYSNYEQEVASGITFTWDNTTTNKVPLSGLVYYNVISNCGYCGVLALGNINVSYNHIYNFLLDFTDGGGIYTINHPESPYGGVSSAFVCDNNIIHDASLSTANTPNSTSYQVLTCGVYLDICCDNAKIRNNAIYNVSGDGIHINYGNQNTTVSGNNVVGGTACLGYVNNPVGTSPVNNRHNIGNICTGNTFVMRRLTGQVCVTVNDTFNNTSYNPFADNGANLGASDNNNYINAYGTSIANIVASSTFPTLAQYKTAFGKDASSVSLTNFILFSTAAEADLENIIVSNFYAIPTVINVGAGYSGYQDATGGVITNQNITIPAFGSYIYLSRSGDKNVRFVSAAAGASSNAINAAIALAYPTGLLNGDLLVVHVTSASGHLVITPPAGWSTLVDDHSSSNGYLFSKISNGTETGTDTFTWTGGSGVNKVGRMYQFRYTPTSAFSEDPKNNVNSGTTTTAPTLTSSLSRELAVSFVNTYNNTGVSAYSGATGGTWVEAVTEVIVTNVGIQLQYALLPTARTISGGTMTTGAAGSVSLNMVFKNVVAI